MKPDLNSKPFISSEVGAPSDIGVVQATIWPKKLKKITTAVFAANLATQIGLGIIMPMLPIFARNMGATGFTLGMIFGAYPLGRLLLTPVVVKFDHFLDRKRFIIGGLVLFVIASAGYLMADSVNLIILMRFLQGIGGAVVLTISMAALGDLAPSHAEGRIMGILQLSLWGGFGVGPIVGGILTDWSGMATCFVVMSGLGALAIVLSIMIMPGIEGPSPGTSKDEWEYRHLLSSRTMIGLIILYCSFSFTRGLTSTFLPLFADQILHLSGKAIGTILTVNILLVGILQWPAGKLADMRGRVFLSSASLTAASITIFMIAWVNDFWQLCLIIIANSLCTSCAVPAMFAIAVDEGRKHGMAQAMSAMAMVQSIGFILGALTGGILMDAIGIQLLFAFGPVAGWIGVGIFLRLVRR